MGGDNPLSALDVAVKAAGGQTELARKITPLLKLSNPKREVKQAHVWKWLNIQKRVETADCVIPIEVVTGVNRKRLRPDLYPCDEQMEHFYAAVS